MGKLFILLDDWYCKQCSSMPSPPTSLPSPVISYSQPLTPSSDSNHQPTTYRLRQSPTHSAKFIESTTPLIMTKETKRKSIKKKPTKQDESHRQLTPDSSIKVHLNTNDSNIIPVKRKRGRPRNIPVVNMEEEELFFKTFGHKLNKQEADTKRGTPEKSDIALFEKAKAKIEVRKKERRKKIVVIELCIYRN